MNTVERETYEAERRAAAIEATWAAVASYGEVFSYQDIYHLVANHLADLGYDRSNGYSPKDQTEPLIREMARAGILRRVRAFNPPSKPHLFEVVD